MGFVLAVIALIFEILHWATTKDSALSFYALVLVTLALLLADGVPAFLRSRTS